jgi:hypothetical protein
MPIIDGVLHIITKSIDSEHLGHAVDQMKKSKRVSQNAQTGFDKMLINRCALSSILHGFCALESIISHLGYEMFFHPKSERYIAPENREPLLKKYIRSWDKAACLDKLSVILFYVANLELTPNLDTRLRELNTLRNWIAHGFSYTTTFLLEPKGDSEPNTYTVVDMENSIDWKSKFPNTKFKPLDKVDYEDAQIALAIVLEVFKLISECIRQPFSLVTCEYDPNYQVLWEDKFDISKILQL